MLTVKKDGCGFVDSIKFGRRQVVMAKAGFAGASVSLAAAGNGTAESLFTNKISRRLVASIEQIKQTGTSINVTGAYTDGKVSVPFTRRMVTGPADGALTVTETADFTGLAQKYLVAEHTLDLPLVISDDPHLRMFAFGGAHRVEMFRMDMNDVRRRGVNISDSRGYWPYWDIGGVLQLPGSYRIWKANHADTMAYPVDENDGTPGWADYSEPAWGMTVKVAASRAAAPWAIKINARKGIFSIQPHPASQPAVSGEDYGKRRFAFTIALHKTSWPAEYPCQLDVKLYERLVRYLIAEDRGAIVKELATDKPRAIVQTERIQPTVAIRAMYRTDGYHMQRLMKRIGKSVPRDQSLAKWDQDALYFLDWVKRNGVPKAAPAKAKKGKKAKTVRKR